MPALERDFVEEGLGHELVGGEADAAQRRGTHPGVTVELLDELVRDVIALQVGAEHEDEVLAAAALESHGIDKGGHPVRGDAMVPRHELA